jgi:hypothetical protein
MDDYQALLKSLLVERYSRPGSPRGDVDDAQRQAQQLRRALATERPATPTPQAPRTNPAPRSPR